MKVETYKCDVCGKQKGDVNHWWIVKFGRSDSHLGMSISSWINDELGLLDNPQYLYGQQVKERNVFHLCGAECVQKKVNEFLGATK